MSGFKVPDDLAKELQDAILNGTWLRSTITVDLNPEHRRPGVVGNPPPARAFVISAEDIVNDTVPAEVTEGLRQAIKESRES